MSERRTVWQWWANVSLRDKITGVTVLILFFGLLVAGVGTMSLLRPTLISSQDAELHQLQSDPTPALQPGAVAESLTREDVVFAPPSYYVALFDVRGNLLYDNVATEGGSGIPRAMNLPVSWIEANQDQIFALEALDGTQWRAVGVPISTSGSTDASGALIIAVSSALVNSVMAQYVTIFFGFSFAVILLGAALTRILVAATFEPLGEVERTAKEISAGDFSKRIHVDTPNTEVGHLGTSLNTMLDRLDGAYRDRAETVDRMRRFIGDAGHELRTPLVSVRGYAELYRLGALDDPEKVRQAMARIEGESIRMTSLVEDLLSLARLDERRPLELKPLDLNVLAHDAAMDANVQSGQRMVRALTLTTAPWALGDENKVRQIMTNLLGNAIRHTEDGTPIEIAVLDAGDVARFEVRDHGEGIPEQSRERIFDRFWRADTSRNRETGGSGLGLAIVSSIVAAHDGSVTVHETPGGGATFRVDLPKAEAGEPTDLPSNDRITDTTSDQNEAAPATKRNWLRMAKLRRRLRSGGSGAAGGIPEDGDGCGESAARPSEPTE